MNLPRNKGRCLGLALLLLAPLAHAGGTNKCVQGQTVVYSDKPCAFEDQTRTLGGGSLSSADSLQQARQHSTYNGYNSSYSNETYYTSSSGKPQVPSLSKQKSVAEQLKERSLSR